MFFGWCFCVVMHGHRGPGELMKRKKAKSTDLYFLILGVRYSDSDLKMKKIHLEASSVNILSVSEWLKDKLAV